MNFTALVDKPIVNYNRGVKWWQATPRNLSQGNQMKLKLVHTPDERFAASSDVYIVSSGTCVILALPKGPQTSLSALGVN